jgi:RNA polymerase sigma factor (sigma-70 family)
LLRWPVAAQRGTRVRRLARRRASVLYSVLCRKKPFQTVYPWRGKLSEITRRDFDDLFERATQQAQRILKDRQRAEDVAAEAMGRLVLGGKTRQQFTLIVHGLSVDALRKLGRETPWDISDGRWHEEHAEDLLHLSQPLTFEQVEFRADFDRAVRALDEDDRQAFLLTEVRGLSTREAAPLLNVSDRTVARRAENARAQIKEAIA